MIRIIPLALCLALSCNVTPPSEAQIELQPFASQVKRLLETLDYVGAPVRADDRTKIEKSLAEYKEGKTTGEIQNVLDQYCLFDIHINPESRVKVTQGAAKPEL